jgi:protein-tyrosine phosphatase
MSSILFVCTANRFRSPIAAIAFARQVVKRGDDHHISISSAGTWTVTDLPATPDALKQAKKYHLNLSFHKSRLISQEILSEADLVLVMDANHKEGITHEFPDVADKVYLLAEVTNGVSYDIPDPYSTDESPAVVAKEIVELIDRGYEKILQLALDKAQHPKEDS